MKIAKILTALLFGAFVIGLEVANAVEPVSVETAVALAGDASASMNDVCKATAGAVESAAVAPSVVFTRVLAARQSWTAGQVAALYKSVLAASPALSSSFAGDVQAFEQAGSPKVVASDAPEGVKLLAALYGANVPGVNPEVILASVVTDVIGAPSLRSVAPLRDVNARAASAVRRPQPAKPTPPAASYEN